MKWKFCTRLVVILGMGLLLIQCKREVSSSESKVEVKTYKPDRQIEVCFVLDTTGSMSGLIEGAKQKIWSIAGEILQANPGAKVRMGLIAYRDRGDAYVTKQFALTDDLDALYSELLQYKADGGGDTPESVNQALAEAVHDMKWSDSSKTLKMIFLVGDAPPHMDYQDDIKYPASCKKAVERGIMINTVQCGNISGTDLVWKEISSLSDGSYVALGQTGDMVVRKTPMDEQLEKLNRKAGETLVPYGSRRQRSEVSAKQSLSEAAPAASIADRLNYNLKSGKTVQGRGDLLDDVKDGLVKVDQLKKEELPQDWKDLDQRQIAQKLEEKQRERKALYKEIAEVTAQRERYIAEEKKKEAAVSGSKDAFDDKVAEAIREQGRKVFGE